MNAKTLSWVLRYGTPVVVFINVQIIEHIQ